SPFLDNFLVDAEAVWEGRGGEPLRSGVWLEPGGDERMPLEAIALHHSGRRVLLLRRQGEAWRQRVESLQTARENRLEQESLEAEVRRQTAQIRDREEEIAMRLTMAVGVRDYETGAHIRRIGQGAAVVAQALGWSADDVADLRIAAPMHDVGKVGVPDDILLKPAGLSAEERIVMQRHTSFGARLLESDDIPLLDLARQIALSHHEAWNGTGYPAGLREDEIPEAARIVTVVDVFDAITHARPYKKALPEAAAVRALEEGRGRVFEETVVEAFLDHLAEVREIARKLRDEDEVEGLEGCELDREVSI
ncbi:MAG: HD domain-containing protein, partial [Thermoanaerobaculia bacterium]|nr:HD domain-containing protein [Thermoanaerobaculia bacterium]